MLRPEALTRASCTVGSGLSMAPATKVASGGDEKKRHSGMTSSTASGKKTNGSTTFHRKVCQNEATQSRSLVSRLLTASGRFHRERRFWQRLATSAELT